MLYMQDSGLVNPSWEEKNLFCNAFEDLVFCARKKTLYLIGAGASYHYVPRYPFYEVIKRHVKTLGAGLLLLPQKS